MRPVLFVTNHAPGYRTPAFALLHEREGIELALVGGGVRHGGGGTDEAALAAAVAESAGSLRVHRVVERDVHALATSGRFRAVIAGISGRIALPAAYLGARRARIPFVLWATLWAHPRTAAHALSALPLRHIYRDADAIVTYGPHVSRYVQRRGARAPVLEAPQAVDGAFWAAPAEHPDRRAAFQALFVGRLELEKGIDVLAAAWRRAALDPAGAALVLVGGGSREPVVGVQATGPLAPTQVRNLMGGSDVLVLPSIPRPDFLEPWGLVVNEAMHQGLPVIATTAVGAAAGGLVEHGRTGLVVPAGDAEALAGALRQVHDDPALRRTLGAAAAERVRGYSFEAWAEGMRRGLAAVGCAQDPLPVALA